MLKVVLLTIVAFAVIAILMSIGVLFGRKPIAGSCGGIASLDKNGSCSFCGKRPNETNCKKTPTQ